MYFDYIHTGDARPLLNVFYHNAVDVVSLATLLDHISHLLSNPLHTHIEHTLDLYAISRLYDDLNRWDEAVQLYHLAIERLEDESVRQEAIRRLALIHKRRGEWESALNLWQQAADAQQLYAFEELAKYHEHFARQPHEAMHWTLTALDWMNTPACPNSQRLEWLPEFQHRLERLKRKTL
jgi:tetratricopeptide (TPR) repeat protein